MSGVGRLAMVPSHRIGKWAVLVLWVVAFAALAPLAQKLTSVEDNQAASWLPGDAESTRVLEVTERFRSINEIPAIVVYEKQSGLSRADLATIADQTRKFNDVERID